MKGWLAGAALLGLLVAAGGCGRPESLSGEELARKYPEKKYLAVGGVRLHFEQQGLGKPAVFLHGLPTWGYVWRKVVPGLAYGTTAYVPDLMGFGFSEKPQDATYSADTYVSQLADFIETLHLENVALVGQGVGGVIATLYTVRHPQRVRALILMGAPLYPGPLPLVLRLARVPLVGELFAGERMLRRLLQEGVAEEGAPLHEKVVAGHLEPYREDPGAAAALVKFLREFGLRAVVEREIGPALHTLTTPTFIVWGDADRYVSLAMAKRLETNLPNARLHVIPGAGHLIQEERPDELVRLLREFLQRPEGSATSGSNARAGAAAAASGHGG